MAWKDVQQTKDMNPEIQESSASYLSIVLISNELRKQFDYIIKVLRENDCGPNYCESSKTIFQEQVWRRHFQI